MAKAGCSYLVAINTLLQCLIINLTLVHTLDGHGEVITVIEAFKYIGSTMVTVSLVYEVPPI